MKCTQSKEVLRLASSKSKQLDRKMLLADPVMMMAIILVLAFLLLFVHGLNIALAVMGVAVHAVRLNTLEFSNGLGQEWSGFAFAPFAKQKN